MAWYKLVHKLTILVSLVSMFWMIINVPTQRPLVPDCAFLAHRRFTPLSLIYVGWQGNIDLLAVIVKGTC